MGLPKSLTLLTPSPAFSRFTMTWVFLEDFFLRSFFIRLFDAGHPVPLQEKAPPTGTER